MTWRRERVVGGYGFLDERERKVRRERWWRVEETRVERVGKWGICVVRLMKRR